MQPVLPSGFGSPLHGMAQAQHHHHMAAQHHHLAALQHQVSPTAGLPRDQDLCDCNHLR